MFQKLSLRLRLNVVSLFSIFTLLLLLLFLVCLVIVIIVVVGDRVVACMRRRARGREFRSNFHLNGTVEPVELDPAFEEVACRAARVLGLRVAGVDLLESVHGPLVLEVNSSPGLEGIEKASGVNVAGEIIDFVINSLIISFLHFL